MVKTNLKLKLGWFRWFGKTNLIMKINKSQCLQLIIVEHIPFLTAATDEPDDFFSSLSRRVSCTTWMTGIQKAWWMEIQQNYNGLAFSSNRTTNLLYKINPTKLAKKHTFKNKSAINLTFNLRCKAIVALFLITYCSLIWGHCKRYCIYGLWTI